ncbi:MAG TPA: four helix bundle protein [Pyrinomonadaceae bacterium]|nr:four helix bundle protein [Pyrinomonadaceae bacterium]
MEKTNFENLHIYRLSERLAEQIWRIVLGWEYFAKNTVGIQIVKAADSVGANIAEGSGRGTEAELRRFLRVARGSLYETQHWLRRAYKRNLLTQKQVDELVPILRELTPKLNAYLGSIGSLRNALAISLRDSNDTI